MRQRVLLIIGWTAAALGAGLVATAAVSVAGGQVLDQPLRPLTAAEVAALPVAHDAALDDLLPPTTSATTPVVDEAAQTNDPIGQVSRSVAGIGGSVSVDTATSGPEVFEPSNPSSVRTGSVEGGHASFRATNDGIALAWVTPNPGYVAQTRSVASNTITVVFSSSLDAWLIEATLDGIDIVIVTRPIRLA